MQINDNIKLIRELSGLTQAQFAELIKTNLSNLKTYENTNVKPKAFVVFNISMLSGISSEDLEKKKLKPEDIKIDRTWVSNVYKDETKQPVPEIKNAYERLIEQIEARRRDYELMAIKMEEHYKNAQTDKEKLFEALKDAQRTINEVLKPIIEKTEAIKINSEKTLNDLQGIRNMTRADDLSMMEGTDKILGRESGTTALEAGIVELSLRDPDQEFDKNAANDTLSSQGKAKQK